MARPYKRSDGQWSSSSGTHQPTEEVSDELSDSEAESCSTEQSFRTACAAMSPETKKVPRNISRKSRFTEQISSFRLTKANLCALDAGHNSIAPEPAIPEDSHVRSEPSSHGKGFLIPRKPLPNSALEINQKKGEEALTQYDKPSHSESDSSPSPPRSNATFTDFLPYHQLRTWQQDDNDEWQRHHAQSLSTVALESMKKLNSGYTNVSVQSKKTANQLKEGIKHRMLDHDK